MKPHVLMLTPQLPYPPHQGTTIRNYHILRYLATRATVTLVTFVDPDQPAPEETPLLRWTKAVHARPTPRRRARERLRSLVTSPLPDLALRLEDPAMHQVVRSLAQDAQVDVLLVEGLEMAPYMLTYLRAHPSSGVRVLFDAHNAEYVLQKRAFLTDIRSPWRWHTALYSLVQWGKLRAYEGAILRRADHVFAVSQRDREHLAALAGDRGVTVVPNGVDVAYYTARSEPNPGMGEPALVFTGKMDYRPNVDAVLWFVQRVWPKVREQAPQARFFVVGKSPHPRILDLNRVPGVVVTGAVPDVRPYLYGATLFVIPLRVGGGTRLKVLEAMATRRAVVSTSLGVEGYPFRHGEHLLIADDAEAFARAVLRLLGDEDVRRQLGERAYAFVRERYDWSRVLQPLGDWV